MTPNGLQLANLGVVPFGHGSFRLNRSSLLVPAVFTHIFFSVEAQPYKHTMSDPFSVAAGVMGIVGVSAQALKMCYQLYEYYDGVKNAPEAMRQIVNELEALEPLLYELRNLAINHPRMHAVQAFTDRNGALDECRRSLEELVEVLNKDLGSKGVRRRIRKLKWPLSEEDTSRSLMRIERIKSTFTLGLSLDNGWVCTTTWYSSWNSVLTSKPSHTAQKLLEISRSMDSTLQDVRVATQSQEKTLQGVKQALESRGDSRKSHSGNIWI